MLRVAHAGAVEGLAVWLSETDTAERDGVPEPVTGGVRVAVTDTVAAAEPDADGLTFPAHTQAHGPAVALVLPLGAEEGHCQVQPLPDHRQPQPDPLPSPEPPPLAAPVPLPPSSSSSLPVPHNHALRADDGASRSVRAMPKRPRDGLQPRSTVHGNLRQLLMTA
jgi:hypothetical protein